MEKKVTLSDIAKKIGVSVTTVSRVLNNDMSLKISTEKRDEIIFLANKLNYKNIAQRYKNQKLKRYKIGIAQMFDMEEQKRDIYYMMMKNVLEEVCNEHNIETINLFRNKEKNFIKINNSKIDGIFPIGRFTLSEISNFEKYTKNIVFLDSSPDELSYHSIIPNYHLGTKLAIKNFLENGHRKIGFIGSKFTYGNTKELEIDSRYVYFKSILEGYELFDENYVIESEMHAESGYKNIKRFVERKKEMPTAFFISSDVIVPGILKLFNEKNIKVPEDISLITFNDTPFSEFSTPALSSIRIFLREYATAALKIMEELWEGEHGVKKIIMPCNLIERESVKTIKD